MTTPKFPETPGEPVFVQPECMSTDGVCIVAVAGCAPEGSCALARWAAARLADDYPHAIELGHDDDPMNDRDGEV